MGMGPGYEGKIQVDYGQTGSFVEVGHVQNAPLDLSAEELAADGWSDSARRRIKGQLDAGVDAEVRFDYDDTGQSNLFDAFLDRGDSSKVDVEWAPNDQGSSGTLLVIAFTAKVFTFSFDPPVDGITGATIGLMLSNGVEPTFSNSFT